MNTRSQGFTLVELLIVLVIGSIVLGAAYQTMATQERTNRQQVAIVSTQDNVRTALDILSADLREISSEKDDILAASSSTIQFHALRKAGVVCARDASLARDWVDVAVLGEQFTQNDTTVIFDDGPNLTASSDDDWRESYVSGIGTGGCAGNPLSATIQRLRYPNPTLATVNVGALVRSYKTYQYSLVDVAGYGKLIRTRAGAVDTLVESLAPNSENGLLMKYYDINGNQITDLTTPANREQVMRIQISVKGKGGGASTANRTEYSDSLVGQVYLRGNARTN